MNHLLIKSSDRLSSSTGSHNFRLQLTTPIENGDYELVSVSMPNSFYVVNDTNNKIYFTDDSTARTATLTNGYYSTSTLPTEIKSAMETANSSFQTYTVSYSSSTSKFTVSAAGNFTFDFASNTSNSARKLLGMNATDDSAATSHTSDNIVDLSGPRIVCIQLNMAGDTLRNSQDDLYCDLYVPMDVDFGEFKYYKPNNEEKQIVRFNLTSNITVRLVDENNNELDLNGLDWEMILRKK